MTNIGPTVTFNETDTTIAYPPGVGGKPVIVIGSDSGLTAGTVYQFSSPAEAISACTSNSTLLNAILQIFEEGGQYIQTDSLGIDTVYAIALPTTPQPSDYTDALTLAESVAAKVEVYPALSNTTILGYLATHLSDLAATGDVRVSVVTVADDTIGDMETEVANLTSDRIVIKENPDTMALAAAKIACTPYDIDPAKGAYRSTPTILTWTRTELETMVSNCISPDWKGPDGPEPYMFVTPAFKLVSGVRLTSGLLHHRLNMDQHIEQIYNKAQKHLKDNNTQNARNLIEQDVSGYLDIEMKDNKIESYVVNVDLDPDNVFGIIISGYIGILGAIYSININMTMNPPTGTIGGV